MVYCKIPVKYAASTRALTVFKTYNAKERVTCRRQRKIRIFSFSWRDLAIFCALFGSAVLLCILLHMASSSEGFAYSIFILTVLLISRFTTGYLFGTLAAVLSVVGTNYIFTYPYWAVNFTLSGYPLTFLTMLAVSLIISAMNTKIKKQERLRTEAERETMRANLLRAMSHDIRTPLTSIVGNTSAILENGDTLSTEQQRELLRDVNEDAQWLIRMVENLLSITRISGEQTAISKEYEAAEEILAASVHKFEKRFKSNIRIAVEVPREVVLVPMDATLIQQVLLNLMENAVLHGESTTELRLSVEHIGDEACFTVSDNGLGIPRERLATLFDGSLSGEKSGGFDMKKNMGIGLSVCQTIVKAHGGRITAENRPEGGAQFRFYLPLKEEKEDEDGFQAGKQATDLGLSAADGRRAADGVRVRGVLCDQRHRAGRRERYRHRAELSVRHARRHRDFAY